MRWGKPSWGTRATESTRRNIICVGDGFVVLESSRRTLAPWSVTPVGTDIRFVGETGYTSPHYTDIQFEGLITRIFVGDHLGTYRENRAPLAVGIEVLETLSLEELVSMILRENAQFETERTDALSIEETPDLEALFSSSDSLKWGEIARLAASFRSGDKAEIEEAARWFRLNVEIMYTVRHRRGCWGAGVWGRRRAGDLHWWTENYLRWGKPFGFVSGKMERYKR